MKKKDGGQQLAARRQRRADGGEEQTAADFLAYKRLGTKRDKVECGKVMRGGMAWSTVPFIEPGRRWWGGERVADGGVLKLQF
jgi:hypothetical protein